MKIAFYYYDINEIGGIETWLYQIAKIYGEKRDITVYYTIGDETQVERLKKYVRVKKYYGQIVKADKAIFCRDMGDIIPNFKAKERIQFAHGVFDEVGYTHLDTHPDIDTYIAVSKRAADAFYKLTGKKCKVLYNPYKVEKPRKVLKLISATRISDDKGSIYERMCTLAKKLNNANIPFIWLVFTNSDININVKGMIKMPPTMDITDYIAESDYLVQLSKSESYSYTAIEALSLGIPVIVNNFSICDEIGIKDGENAYVLDLDMHNVDVDKIYNKIPKGFKFEIPKFDKGYLELLGPENKIKTKEKMVRVKCVIPDGFEDIESNKHRRRNEVWTTSYERACYLEDYKDPTDFTNYHLVDIID